MSCKTIGTLYGGDGDKFERWYRDHLSGYHNWEQLSHASEWILFEKNIGAYVGLDEVCLSRGELYTVLVNKEKKGGRGSIIAIIKGTRTEDVCRVLLQMPRRRRFQVREITLDMASNMAKIAATCFPVARQVIDRFHVQQLAFEALQDMRIKARWEALDEENREILKAKIQQTHYTPKTFENGDTRAQLLVRSIYLLYKKESLWSNEQKERAKILFREYPNIKKAYYLAMGLGLVYHQAKSKGVAYTMLARWYDRVERSGFVAFAKVMRTIYMHYEKILNFFDKRSTNAASESFNSKIKAFRAQFRGVKDKDFFLFRLAKLYA